MCYLDKRLYGTLCEYVCFHNFVRFGIFGFQAAAQRVAGIVCSENVSVFNVADKSERLHKRFVTRIQIALQLRKLLIGARVTLRVHQLIKRVSNANQAAHSGSVPAFQLDLRHYVVLAKIDFPINFRVGEIPHIRCRGNCAVLLDTFFLTPRHDNIPLERPYRAVELLFQICSLNRHTSCFLAVSSAYKPHFAEYHLGVIRKILIYRDTLRNLRSIAPIGLFDRHFFSFLKKNNIRGNFRTRVCFESIIW